MQRLHAVVAALGCACCAVQAQQLAQVERIVIKGQAITERQDQPYSVRRFDQRDLRERQVLQTQQLYREVAGMEVRGLGYDGVADSITLRGFSGGGHGGDIGFVVDGIPLNEASSHADGYADINVLVPLEIEGMDVFKGPVSALYGNFNRAGVVALRSRKGGEYREADARVGSHELADVQAAYGGKLGGTTLNAAAQLHHNGGWRPDTDSNRATISGRVAFDLGKATQASVAARAHRADSTTASVITQAQYERRAGFYDKDPHVQNDGADKDYATLRADAAHTLSLDLKVLAFVYGTDQNFTRYFTRPTNATTWQQRSEDYKRHVLGYGVNLNGEQRVAGGPLRWVAGVERYEEKTRYRYADALNQRAPTATTFTAGVDGGAGTLDRLLTIETSSLLAQAEWALAPLFRPSAGLRHDRIGGGCERGGIETRTGASAQCAAMDTMAVTTPKAGVRSTWIDRLLEARASVSEGFALPSDAAKFTPGLTVDPTVFRQTELGLSFTPVAGLSADVAVFRVNSRAEIALVDSANLVYANIGSTRREGVEVELRWHAAPWLEATAALSRNRSHVVESLPATPWLVGSEVTGVARTMATVGVTVQPTDRISVGATARSVGRTAITQPTASAGQRYHGGYETLDLMAAWTPDGGDGTGFQRYHVQVANAADKRYATSTGVTSGVQTYNPGAPRTVTLGASLDF